jgi:mannitol/fructose-specific phosphotransferase system IIA component (Ntr-type)
MRLGELIDKPERVVLDVHARDRWQAIDELVDALVAAGRIQPADRDAVATAVRQREETMSTGIGAGIGIPHAAMAQVATVEGILGVSTGGVDFDALDGAPVHIIMLFLVPQQQFQAHLDTLADIARVLCQREIRERICAATSAAQVVETIHAASSA